RTGPRLHHCPGDEGDAGRALPARDPRPLLRGRRARRSRTRGRLPRGGGAPAGRRGAAPGGAAVESRPVAIFDRAIVRLLPAVPRPVVQKLSERYIAGPELKDAREAVRRINAEGKLATVDVLGEEITTAEEAAAIVRAYQDVFADIERCGLDANVSVKLTALGLKLDYELCRDNLRTVVEA